MLAQIKEIGVARVVLCEAECRPWYREEGVQRWFLGRSVGSRGVAGCGSAATSPMGAPGGGILGRLGRSSAGCQRAVRGIGQGIANEISDYQKRGLKLCKC